LIPIEPSVLAAFIIAVLALVMSPGPDTMLILRYTLTSGQRVGLATVAGVQLGLLVHTAAAALGLSLLIASSPTLFRGVAILGAAYLGWLGLQSLRAATPVLGGKGITVAASKAARDAMITNILNPKVIMLFLALMPQFVDAERGAVPSQLVALGVLLILVNTLWQVGLALLAEGIRLWLIRPVVQRAVSWATGSVLLLFAGLMLFEHFS
jgi:threonine/homoserine/homoserine lactone efflux protein